MVSFVPELPTDDAGDLDGDEGEDREEPVVSGDDAVEATDQAASDVEDVLISDEGGSGHAV